MMLRRPLAALLSSVSTRCLQSTRLFGATATSSNDRITTTGIRQFTSRADFKNTVDIRSPDYESDLTITPKDALPLEGRTIPTVYVAGRSIRENWYYGLATFWDPESIEHLENYQRPLGFVGKELRRSSTHFKAELVAITHALIEAQTLNLREIRVITNSPQFIQSFKRGWQNKDGSDMYSKYLYLEIKALTEHIKVHFKGVELTDDSDDELVKKVYEMADVPRKEGKSVDVDFTSPDCKSDWTITPSDVSPLEGRTVPTVYVRGNHRSKKKGSIASLWTDKSIEHLETDQRPLGSTQRLSIYPVDHFLTQLIAIREAIKEAQVLNLPEIQVVTISLAFMYYFTREWKRADGSSVANEKLYFEIKTLIETTKVHFKTVRFTKGSDDELMKKVYEMTKEGLGYPMMNKDDVKE